MIPDPHTCFGLEQFPHKGRTTVKYKNDTHTKAGWRINHTVKRKTVNKDGSIRCITRTAVIRCVYCLMCGKLLPLPKITDLLGEKE
jgi:formate hydrogenlyase subunit 6/NADH:ubiquinone oxidoreductase subunit I